MVKQSKKIFKQKLDTHYTKKEIVNSAKITALTLTSNVAKMFARILQDSENKVR